MALLEKLCICGIRSFSPQDPVTIEFSTPLTLFLGQNGCGKTTVIECIKYGLTGDLPDNCDQGKRFVNDPKLTERISTKANVKLQFQDCKGCHVTISRAMEVMKKSDGKATFKRIDGTIRWENADRTKREDMSGRCVDVDSYCAQKLNVSKAILNSVLFCHQEDSNWPLDTPQSLKKKFDEIFGATEYNNCVNTLRKLVKDKKHRIDVLMSEYSAKKDLKMFVDSEKEKLNSKRVQLENISKNIEEKNRELVPLKKRRDEILELENHLGRLQRNLTEKETEMKGVESQKRSLVQQVDQLFEGTDEQLEERILSFENDQQNTKKILIEKDKNKKVLENEIVIANKEQGNLSEWLGQLREEENQHKKKIEERNTSIEKAANKLEIPDVSKNEEPEMAIQLIKQKIQSMEIAYNKLTKEKENEEKELQKIIDETREQYVSSKQNADSKSTLKNDLEKKKNNFKLRLSQLEASSSQIRVMENKIEALQINLKKRTDEFDENAKIQEILDIKTKIEQKERKLETLEHEYKQLQQNYFAEQSIDKENSSILEKEQKINNINIIHHENFEKLFSGNKPERNYETALKNMQSREEIRFDTLTKKIKNVEKEVTTLETSIKHSSDSLKQAKEELEYKKNKVDSICKGRPFQDVLSETHNRKEKLQKDKGQYRSAQVMYEAFISEFEKREACCPICETDFSNKQSATSQIIRKLRGKIQEVPNRLTVVEQELKREEELYNKLQQLRPISEEIRILEEQKIPQLESKLDESKVKYEDSSMELAALKNDLEGPKRVLELTRKVLPDARMLDNYSAEIEKSKGTLEELKGQLVPVASDRSRDEVDSEIDELKMELSNDRKQQENMKKLLDQHKERVHVMRNNVQNEIQKKLETEKLLQEKPMIENQYKEIVSKIEELSAEVDMLRDIASEYEDKLKSCIEEKERIVVRNKTEKELEHNKVLSNKKLFDDIERLHNSIVHYMQSGCDKKLALVQEKLVEIKSKIQSFEKQRNELINEISNLQQTLAKNETNFRELMDNKKIRELDKKVNVLKEKVTQLREQIGGHDPRSLFDEKQRIQDTWDNCSREINVMYGEQKEVENIIKDIEKELSKSKNKNAEKEYLRKYYELTTEKLATDDLDTYARVLEISILKFHKDRMMHVNKTIRELWRDIYTGNDIDYIEIQADDTIGANTKQRKYNYSVMQVRKGTKLDMRGQCSAGQRVLACLVIRMALAETFSAHCGMLALDEPTTNLDSVNIQSLSTALAKIVSEREQQRNFQLLVITHDEEFLQTLTRDLSVSHLWRVSRNPDGFSVIKREMI